MFKPGDVAIVFDERRGEKVREATVKRVSRPDDSSAALWLEGDKGPAEWKANGEGRRFRWGQRLITREGYQAALKEAEAKHAHQAFVDEASALFCGITPYYGNTRAEVIAKVTAARDLINAWLEGVSK